MRITLSFVAVVAAIVVAGSLFRRWERSRQLAFPDEAGSTAAVAAMARVEARKVLTHPTWLLTLLLTTALTGALLLADSSGSVYSDAPASWFALIPLPLAGLALVVSLHRIGTRSRRHRTEELEAAMPTAPRARTSALLVACLASLPVLVATMAVAVITSQLAYDLLPDPTWSNLFPAVGFLLVGVGGGVVGVLLSRWLPFVVAPLLGIVALLWLNNGVEHLDPRFRWLRPAVEADFGGRFDVKPMGWSAVFVVGLIGLGACLALWRHPARPALVGSTAVAVLVVVGSGWTMTRTPSAGEIAERVDMLENPTDHQHCESRGTVRYCVFEGAEGWIGVWDPAVRSVIDQLPEAARPASLEVVQRDTVGTLDYLPQVAAAVDVAEAWPADGALHPPLDLENERFPDMTVAWQTAAKAVGLPPATDWQRPAGCMAGGQARLVLAHLLAGRATPTTEGALRHKARDVRNGSAGGRPVPMDLEYDYGDDPTPPGGIEAVAGADVAADRLSSREYIAVAGASGWGRDVMAAAELLEADRGAVDRVIREHWDELVDPATSTARFLELAGIPWDPGSRAQTAVGEPTACP